MKNQTLKRWDRPRTAWTVVHRSRTLIEFGHNLRDWLHELKQISSRSAFWAAIKRRPPLSRLNAQDRELAEAFLAAQVEYLALEANIPPPKWVYDSRFILADPWFSVTAPEVRADLLVLSPPPFKNRNLFTLPEDVVGIRRGRPKVSAAQKLDNNRLRQQRWRVAHRAQR